jgi:ergothioneine biosynthesis protein EgtB
VSTDVFTATADQIATDRLAQRYLAVRRFTERLREPLSAEDCALQSMPDASPAKWHLAHTTWFFETFVLGGEPDYEPFDPDFRTLFNSYYNEVGDQFPRPCRGLISRPDLQEVRLYREYVDDRLLQRLQTRSLSPTQTAVVELGLHHEQQHQELLLTDIKHLLAANPRKPVYREAAPLEQSDAQPLRWVEFPEGMRQIGHEGEGFAFDNESPRHRVFLESFQLASRPVTCGEFVEFIEDGGYVNVALWLDAGWRERETQQWRAPLYWTDQEGAWHLFTLGGPRRIDPAEPVCHVSYFEADAFARWAGARLPTEAEWEVASEQVAIEGNFADTLLADKRPLHPRARPSGPGEPTQMFGDVWEWTSSAYAPYPGYRPPAGAMGEYNAKFMCNQYVLRGGSCATVQDHIRPTYRNFFQPAARWQFTGFRLAR